MSDQAQRLLDALLIVRYQAGDDGALEELIRRHEGPLRAVVVRWLGRHSAAVDDLCQQVWVSVVTGLPRLTRPLAWQAWLGKIARAQVALYFRRKDRATVPLDAVCDPEASVPEQPFDWEKLRVALAELGDPYESMLRMRYWESRSYQQIADALQVPLGTVRSRLHWARARLTKLLEVLET